MITGDECGPNFLTYVLRLRKNPGKNLNQEIDPTEDRTSGRCVRSTMLPLDHSGGHLFRSRVRKSRYWGEMLRSPIHCCDVTKPPYLLGGELCTSPLHSNRLFVYTVCCRRRGQCFSELRTRHTDVVGDSNGRSYVTEQWHNVLLLRTRALDRPNSLASLGSHRELSTSWILLWYGIW